VAAGSDPGWDTFLYDPRRLSPFGFLEETPLFCLAFSRSLVSFAAFPRVLFAFYSRFYKAYGLLFYFLVCQILSLSLFFSFFCMGGCRFILPPPPVGVTL